MLNGENLINRKLFKRLSYSYKIKSYTVLFKVVTAYSPLDYENFNFVGWICLIMNKKPVFFKRPKDKSLEWYAFGWKEIFKNNYKYVGPNKENYTCSWPVNTWYIINYNFISKIIEVKEWNT